MRDYYNILGVSKNASADEIKRAYRELAMKLHPDRNKDSGAEEKFKEVNEAYAVLGDPEKRRQYDSVGHEQFNKRFTEEDIFRGFNPEDLFGSIFGSGGFGTVGDLFGREAQRQTGVNIHLPFNDLERGIDKEFVVEYYRTCGNCSGTGGEPGSKLTKCPSCNGAGKRHVQQNTPFGRLQMTTICEKCGGKGKTFERECRECRGNGTVPVKEKFRLRAEKTSSESPRKKFW